MGSSDSDSDTEECPLCMEPLDVADQNFFPCPCTYQICGFCWHKIRNEGNGLCPACRQAYGDRPAEFKAIDAATIRKMKAEKKKRDAEKKQKESELRRYMSNLRITQKTLVYVIGLSPRMADEEIIRRQEYFGQYGKITKVVVNKSNLHPGQTGPSFSAFITYARKEDAAAVIAAVDQVVLDGRQLRASFGTTKYCTHFLRNTSCPNPDCMYLHELGEDQKTFQKEEMRIFQSIQKMEESGMSHATASTSAISDPLHAEVPARKLTSREELESWEEALSLDSGDEDSIPPMASHTASRTSTSSSVGNSALPANASWAKPRPASPTVASKPATPWGSVASPVASSRDPTPGEAMRMFTSSTPSPTPDQVTTKVKKAKPPGHPTPPPQSTETYTPPPIVEPDTKSVQSVTESGPVTPVTPSGGGDTSSFPALTATKPKKKTDTSKSAKKDKGKSNKSKPSKYTEMEEPVFATPTPPSKSPRVDTPSPAPVDEEETVAISSNVVEKENINEEPATATTTIDQLQYVDTLSHVRHGTDAENVHDGPSVADMALFGDTREHENLPPMADTAPPCASLPVMSPMAELAVPSASATSTTKRISPVDSVLATFNASVADDFELKGSALPDTQTLSPPRSSLAELWGAPVYNNQNGTHSSVMNNDGPNYDDNLDMGGAFANLLASFGRLSAAESQFSSSTVDAVFDTQNAFAFEALQSQPPPPPLQQSRFSFAQSHTMPPGLPAPSSRSSLDNVPHMQSTWNTRGPHDPPSQNNTSTIQSWQDSLQALLPDVNISFASSTMGGPANPPPGLRGQAQHGLPPPHSHSPFPPPLPPPGTWGSTPGNMNWHSAPQPPPGLGYPSGGPIDPWRNAHGFRYGHDPMLHTAHANAPQSQPPRNLHAQDNMLSSWMNAQAPQGPFGSGFNRQPPPPPPGLGGWNFPPGNTYGHSAVPPPPGIVHPGPRGMPLDNANDRMMGHNDGLSMSSNNNSNMGIGPADFVTASIDALVDD